MDKRIAQIIRLLLQCYKDTQEKRLLDIIERLTYINPEGTATPDFTPVQVCLIGADGKTTTLEGLHVTFTDSCDVTALDPKASASYSREASVKDEENKDDDDNGERGTS